jgi:hypothetical protein
MTPSEAEEITSQTVGGIAKQFQVSASALMRRVKRYIPTITSQGRVRALGIYNVDGSYIPGPTCIPLAAWQIPVVEAAAKDLAWDARKRPSRVVSYFATA